jgi:lipopolysaccharide cholinephosphotransferase
MGGYYEMFAKYVDTSITIKLTEAQRELRSDKHLWIDIFPLDGLPKNENDISRMKRKCLFLKKIYRFTMKDYTFKGRVLKNACFRIANIFFSKKKLYKKILDLLKKYPFEAAEQVVSACEMNSGFYIYPHNIFGNERKMLFEGRLFSVPKKSEKYLEFQYGDYLKLPPENERESHSFVLQEKDHVI